MTSQEKKLKKEEMKIRVKQERNAVKEAKKISKEELSIKRGEIKEARKTQQKNYKILPKGADRNESKWEFKTYNRIRTLPVKLTAWAIAIALISSPFIALYVSATLPDSSELTQIKESARLVAEDVQKEGTVLLKNVDDILPLQNMKVNLFGARTITPSLGGGGSGSIGSNPAVELYQAMDEVGFDLNMDLYNLYSNWGFDGEVSTDEYIKDDKKSYFSTVLPNIAGILATEKIEEIPVDKIPNSVIESAKEHSDTAIVMFGVSARESVDASGHSDQTKETLSLKPNDYELLDMLNSEFQNVIVLINSGNAMELGFLEEYDNIKAALWFGFPGEVGFRAIAKILNGEYNPSGKTVDTFAYDSMSSPAAKLFGHFGYDNLEEQNFVNYSEGIYVGYRYYETFITDQKEYAETVQFPFGYGLSYTTFDWETTDFSVTDEIIDVSVKVTNTGDVAGKDVVQIYATTPYYPESGIEKSTMELCGFDKTKLLNPDESEVLTISIKQEDLASYDYKVKEAYILEKGEYEIKIGKNVHDIIDTNTFDIEETIIYDQDSITNTDIKNLFDQANNDLVYLSRSDYENTLEQIFEIDYTASQSVIDALETQITPTEGSLPTMGADNNIKLKDLSGLTYEDEKWQLFLDQFELDEMMKMAGSAGWKTVAVDRLGVPKTLNYDGPASVGHYFSNWKTVGFPCEVIVAATWNEDLQYEMAQEIAKEGVYHGMNLWYAPAMNTHRTPFGVRNFEYFSEDPLVAGKAASAMVRGASSQGVGSTIKHFAMNEQDTHRTGVFTWSNEQAMREIYLKPFEISVKEGNAVAAMTAMNRIGHTWCGEYSELLNDLLRDEWGFRGFVVTDLTLADFMKASNCVTNGNDGMLFLTGSQHIKNLEEAYEIDPVGISHGLRTSVHNICYMVLQTNAMDNEL